MLDSQRLQVGAIPEGRHRETLSQNMWDLLGALQGMLCCLNHKKPYQPYQPNYQTHSNTSKLHLGSIPPQTNDVAFLATSCGVLHLKDLRPKLAGAAVHQMHVEGSGVGAATGVPAQELGDAF